MQNETKFMFEFYDPGSGQDRKMEFYYDLPYAGPAIRPLVQKHGQGYDKYTKYYNSVYLRHNIHLFSPPGSRLSKPDAF